MPEYGICRKKDTQQFLLLSICVYHDFLQRSVKALRASSPNKL